MSAANCTTHFHACDCREAVFAEMVEVMQLWADCIETEIEIVANMRALIARATDQGEMK